MRHFERNFLSETFRVRHFESHTQKIDFVMFMGDQKLLQLLGDTYLFDDTLHFPQHHFSYKSRHIIM